jgi:hypothetical protein
MQAAAALTHPPAIYRIFCALQRGRGGKIASVPGGEDVVSPQQPTREKGEGFNPAISFYCWSEMYPKWRNVTGTRVYPTEHVANYAPARVNENLTEYLQ